jgi:hypothetical protein
MLLRPAFKVSLVSNFDHYTVIWIGFQSWQASESVGPRAGGNAGIVRAAGRQLAIAFVPKFDTVIQVGSDLGPPLLICHSVPKAVEFENLTDCTAADG